MKILPLFLIKGGCSCKPLSMANPYVDYIKEVLGVDKVLASTDIFSVVENSGAQALQVAFLVNQEISENAKSLVNKMSLMCPLQPAKVIYIDVRLGINELEKQLQDHGPNKALLFGEELFHLVKSKDANFFDYINSPIDFENVKIYASHDLEDMCKGPNVNLLKKQVWQQMKQISQSP